jgi:hypothetical protein
MAKSDPVLTVSFMHSRDSSVKRDVITNVLPYSVREGSYKRTEAYLVVGLQKSRSFPRLETRAHMSTYSLKLGLTISRRFGNYHAVRPRHP